MSSTRSPSNRSARSRQALVLACVALGLGAPARGQLPEPPRPSEAAAEASEEISREAIVARRDELRREIEALERQAEAAPREAAAPAAERELLEGIDRLLVLQLGELRREEELQVEAGRLSELRAAGPEAHFGHPPPYSVAELDAVLVDLEAAAAATALSAEASQEIEREMEGARRDLEDQEREERLARDQAAAPERLRRLALEVETRREELRLRRLRRRNAGSGLEIQRDREERLRQLLRAVREQLAPSQEELAEILASLAERDAQHDESLDAVPGQIAAAEDRWLAAQERMKAAADPDAALVAQVAALRLEVATLEHRRELLQKQRLRIRQLEDLWRIRFRILRDEADAEELIRSAGELRARTDDLDRERRLTEARLTQRRLSLSTLRERLGGTAGPGERRWLDEQRGQLQLAVEYYERELEEIDRVADLVRRIQAELESRSGAIDVGDRLGILWDDFAEVWSYEITKADGSPITVGKVVGALLLILVGYLVSKILSRRLGQLVLPRLGVAKGAAVAFQTLLYYALFAIFFLWALHLVNIPLTVFTVLGGVLAIGIGFGSQNIMNNFISGLIILAERPIKVGDLIEVDGVFGQVERIGPRSSRIRAGDNTHIVVPNSAFLEKNVLNWTVSDDVMRTSVDVGVAYGSPVAEVMSRLERAIAEEPDVLRDPPSEILFMEFGDNALLFRAYFWVRVTRSLDRYRFQSRLRVRINELFEEAGLVIAFPQRDVHLDFGSGPPVAVRVVSEPGAGGGTDDGENGRSA